MLDLDRVVTDLKHDRLAADLSVAEAAPLLHATDSYGKHRKKYSAFYESKFPELHWRLHSATGRPDVMGAQHAPFHSRPTLPTGELVHDSFALRRCTSMGDGSAPRGHLARHCGLLSRLIFLKMLYVSLELVTSSSFAVFCAYSTVSLKVQAQESSAQRTEVAMLQKRLEHAWSSSCPRPRQCRRGSTSRQALPAGLQAAGQDHLVRKGLGQPPPKRPKSFSGLRGGVEP